MRRDKRRQKERMKAAMSKMMTKKTDSFCDDRLRKTDKIE
jgi:hypothetical protein